MYECKQENKNRKEIERGHNRYAVWQQIRPNM